MVKEFRDFLLRGNVVDFLNALIAFILVALAIYFFAVKPVNALEARRQRAEVDTPTTKTCTECASSIPLAAKRRPFCTQLQPWRGGRPNPTPCCKRPHENW
ncbi:MAG TPA: hypothetical protein VMM78_19025 [Thermomicrobiales bacterium]|nr:hypothetical protein [Thermomicrobiales bacterium]